MDSKELSKEKSEKSAIKRLIEISQKENHFDSTNSDNELDSWIVQKTKLHSKPSSSSTKPLSSRPATALGKPPRSKKSDLKPSGKPDIPNPRNLLPKRVYLVAPTVQSNFLNPPIHFKLQIRSSSLKSEREAPKAVFERNHTNDINFTFKRKMMKYKLFGESLDKEKQEGVNLINFPRFIL